MTGIRRKVATFMSADVVSRTGRLNTDESSTIEALRKRREIFDRLVREHDGRQFGSTGNARMVEFSSPLQALRCAISIQHSVQEENDSLPPDEQILLRIGLHLGEVIDEGDGNLYGAGISLAGQLQALADSGGISLSGAIHEHVKEAGNFESTGQQWLKDVTNPLTTYKVAGLGETRRYRSLWSEFKRRNVVRVGAAYLVACWLLVQVASTVLPTFDAAPWIMRTLLIVLVLGFPISLLLAWLYELTPLGLMRSEDNIRLPGPDRPRRRRIDGVIVVTLVVAVVFLVVDNYELLRGRTLLTEQRSIAVLPFETVDPDGESDYFSDGLAEELLNVLARVPELRVAPRTTSFGFRGSGISASNIAETLGVQYVLEGSVRSDGDRVRIIATLVDNDQVSWTAAFDRELADVIEIQTEIARSVASQIVPVLSPESQLTVSRRPTENIDAYDVYLRGLDYLNRPDEANTLGIAVEMFGRAIMLDARFAAAWAARCKARLGQYQFSGGDDRYFNEAEADCRRAWTLDNSMWEVHVALGRLYSLSGQYEDAIVELRAAISQQPSAAEAYLRLGGIFSRQNRLAEAESMLESAMALDGGNWRVYVELGHFLYDNERYEEAIVQYSRVAEFTPDSGVGWDNLGNAYWATGNFEKAADAFHRSLSITPSRWAYSGLGSMQYYLGDFEESVENQLHSIELAPEDHVAWGRLAEAYRFIPGAESEADAAHRRAIELVRSDLLVDPDHWDNIGLLAVYHSFIGEFDEALAQLQRMRELAPEEPFAHYYEALVQWQRRDADAALDALRAAVDLGVPTLFILEDPTLADLSDDPRFRAIVATNQ